MIGEKMSPWEQWRKQDNALPMLGWLHSVVVQLESEKMARVEREHAAKIEAKMKEADTGFMFHDVIVKLLELHAITKASPPDEQKAVWVVLAIKHELDRIFQVIHTKHQEAKGVEDDG